ncbi:hypothetical protein [Lactobacillus brevis] [Lactiplantibacillus mudanjiangensis]|uniref:hypothetical protein n=1 Tax=Lactiplantibacillus mudanjiangensis TaxID=1296538 RepID=UPI0010142222|nr:hypothetical protein [Lactiplantibacillus mudanjiangensis]VDG31202.1 hypothetical protein [Lactobacillus brevis] [Lactiplantibacillus mudanjiangensis]
MKKMINFATIIITTLSLFIAFQKPQPAHALASYWKTSHWVTLKKDVTVYKLSNKPWDKKVATYKVKAGSHYKLSHWDVNYSWVLQSGKYNTNGGHYTYMVNKKYNDASWFKMGIYKVQTPLYKSFHGYRVENKNLGNGNTFYDTETHCTLSDYSPNQTSKIIFDYGSHVYPTHHEWDKMTETKMYTYKYKYGEWVLVSTCKF